MEYCLLSRSSLDLLKHIHIWTHRAEPVRASIPQSSGQPELYSHHLLSQGEILFPYGRAGTLEWSSGTMGYFCGSILVTLRI